MTIHTIPDYHTQPNNFIVWLGISPLRMASTRTYNYTDTNLFCDNRGKRVHIGNATAYSENYYKSGNQAWTRPKYNLFLYMPLIRLYRVNTHELFTNYLHVSKDPYYVYINHFQPDANNNPGSIIFQAQKHGIDRKSQKPII